MKTRLALLKQQLAEALAANEPMAWHSYIALVLGYVVLLVAALVLLFVIVDVLTEKRWLRKAEPAKTECGLCAPPHWFCSEHKAWARSEGNHTNTLSIVEMREVPKDAS